jgi:hypothetical protein
MDHRAARDAGARPNVCYALDDGHFALTHSGVAYGSLDACVTAGALLARAQSAQVLSQEQSRFAAQFSDSVGENAAAEMWFWPLVGAFAVLGLLLALRDLRRKRREAFA